MAGLVSGARLLAASEREAARALDEARTVDKVDPGVQVKIFRRLGVSPGPLALNGPVTVSVSTCGRPVAS